MMANDLDYRLDMALHRMALACTVHQAQEIVEAAHPGYMGAYFCYPVDTSWMRYIHAAIVNVDGAS